jgi:hypothetical protein
MCNIWSNSVKNVVKAWPLLRSVTLQQLVQADIGDFIYVLYGNYSNLESVRTNCSSDIGYPIKWFTNPNPCLQSVIYVTIDFNVFVP